MTPSEEIYNGEELSDTMIVFCGLSNQKLDQALLALKKSGAGPFPYKAILTPTNQHWLAKDCLAELKREHEYMTAGEMHDLPGLFKTRTGFHTDFYKIRLFLTTPHGCPVQ